MPQVSTATHTAVDSVGLLVGDLDAEFLQRCQPFLAHIAGLATNLLDCHDYFYGIQAVKTKVVVEVRLGVKLQKMSICPARCSCTMNSYLRGVVDLL